jgi:serine/threonine-protein kinase
VNVRIAAVTAYFSNRVSRTGSACLSLLSPLARPGDLGTLGVYDIEAEIGRGGMGVVYRARDRTLGRIVALKVLRPDMDDEQVRQRFAREVRAASRVEHDFLVRVYSVLSFTSASVD